MVRDMATKENNIALSFDKAEYYTLQEASEYLNRKHGIDNITPRKLLKHIVSYDTPCFIYGKGFNLFGEYEIELSDKKKIELQKREHRSKSILLPMFSFCYFKGLIKRRSLL